MASFCWLLELFSWKRAIVSMNLAGFLVRACRPSAGMKANQNELTRLGLTAQVGTCVRGFTSKSSVVVSSLALAAGTPERRKHTCNAGRNLREL